MGLFDLPGPLFTALDSLMSGLPAFARLLIWATFTGIISMLLYWLCSAQEKTGEAKERAIAARKAMASYDGTEMDEMLPLAKESLVASLKHFGIVLGPALLSSLPALAIIVWVSGAFGYQQPAPGSEVISYTVPTVAINDATEVADSNGAAWTLTWPAEGESRELVAANGEVLTSLPLNAPIPVVHKKLWWNSLIANPNGYLPDEYEVEAVYFELGSMEFLSFGPGWVRGWEFSYFVLLILVSLGVKVAFKIH